MWDWKPAEGGFDKKTPAAYTFDYSQEINGNTMKRVLIVLAPGFEEIESITVIDILRRAGARVDVAGTETGLLEGSRGVKVMPDMLVSEVNSKDYDLVVLPGGQPGVTNLQGNDRVLAIVQEMDRDRKTVAAICAAPMVLQTAGILGKRHATSHPSVQDKLDGVQYTEDRMAPHTIHSCLMSL